MLNLLKIQKQIDYFLEEDIGMFDVTSTVMIDPDAHGAFNLNARQSLVVSGIDVARLVFERYVPDITIDIRAKDGDRVEKGACLMSVSGNAQNILTAERNALNLLQHMSGIATETARYVKAIEGTGCQLLDTRKTTPGLRMLQKHAVVCGGGRNHRLSLDNGLMIKDNHIVVCGSITAAVKKAKALVPALIMVEVECDRLDQVREAFDAGADLIMLDNMGLKMLREAVKIVDGGVPLEASGGISLETIRPIAETGVDYASVGRITQSSPAVDIGLDGAK
ncbi:MAG: carboxylating nicotinate-nucleotide diphosphorylase [Rhodospirillaceae bacterium]|nr:carboxylating nicotinate-nucleotide diphosphorylase [Rhodospirillaceae bacterium]